MTTYEILLQNTSEIENKIGYTFKDKEIMALAFVHRSYANENKNVNQHNERLEFLGDSILGLLIAEYLYKQLPTTPEGDLSALRSRLVEASSCVNYMQILGIGDHTLLGKGERMNDGRGRESILADLFEAIIAAIYLDGGYEAAKHFLFHNFSDEIDRIIKTPNRNWKADLQDYCQKKYQAIPDYTVLSETGPDHSKQFLIAVVIDGQELGRGSGSSKKEAQQEAAADALAKVSNLP
ncbi:MAG: ribonuclease III [Chlamydiia bacterium]|nr:ribonuclease III [Chlamydiia bacterium]